MALVQVAEYATGKLPSRPQLDAKPRLSVRKFPFLEFSPIGALFGQKSGEIGAKFALL